MKNLKNFYANLKNSLRLGTTKMRTERKQLCHMLRRRTITRFPLSEIIMRDYQAFDKLVHPVLEDGKSGCPLVVVDLERPMVHISHSAFRVFMCNAKGEANTNNMVGFMSHARFYINFNRCYIRGMLSNEYESSDSRINKEERTTVLQPIANDAWLNFIVYSDDEERDIQYVGKARLDEIKFREWHSDEHVERLYQRLEYVEDYINGEPTNNTRNETIFK